MFCGLEMTAESYDDDAALRAYVRKHFPQLMTPLERRVTEYTTPIVSNSTNYLINKFSNTPKTVAPIEIHFKPPRTISPCLRGFFSTSSVANEEIEYDIRLPF